ncbi:MAG: hypothetical protein GEU95_20490 [Rhizobiales bacterium]|nr:hypothetical protein [Hyphomicrobiales bacterium]
MSTPDTYTRPDGAETAGRVERLTAAILEDRDRPQSSNETHACFACGRPFMWGQSGSVRRFCSQGCVDYFDSGAPPYDPTYTNKNNQRWYTLPLGKHGSLINCKGCGRQFDSKGLRCCSRDCEREHRDRRDNAKLMAEAGMSPSHKRLCQRPGCTRPIPRWKNGKATRKDCRFCTEKCADKARGR